MAGFVAANESLVAAVVGLVVTASLPFYLYGAWIVLREDVVTWSVLTHHLRYVGAGLVLTTGPVLVWMVPRFLDQLPSSLAALHAFLGLQAYALLAFGLTGIVRIFQAKRDQDLYHDPDPDVGLSDLHEHADDWRRRLRIGVFGYVLFWLLAWVVGVVRFGLRYGPLG